jgi:ABC-type multidrug transport system permease subunit
MNGLVKAFRLEMEHVFSSKVKALSHFIIPIAIVAVLAEAGTQQCRWCYFDDATNTYSYFDFYSSLIFSTAMLFIATQLTVLRIVGERAPYGTLDRDLLAISRTEMYLGKFLAALTVVAVQSSLIIIVGKRYGMILEGSTFDFFIVLFLLSAVGLALGMLFSVFSKSKEQAVQLVPFAVLVFLTLSGDLIPDSDMPPVFAFLAQNSPVTLANVALREIMLLGSGISEESGNVIRLTIWVVGLLLAGVLKFRFEKR